MRYTKEQIRKAIKIMEPKRHDIITTEFNVAVSCMRECLRNMQETFNTGDILYRGPNEYNGDWGIFLEYSNDNATACHVLTITRSGNIGNSCWVVEDVEKTGHIDIGGIESVLQTGEQA